MEAAGCLVFEEDFATSTSTELSQWVDDYPVMLINANAAPDQNTDPLKRRTKNEPRLAVP